MKRMKKKKDKTTYHEGHEVHEGKLKATPLRAPSWLNQFCKVLKKCEVKFSSPVQSSG